MFRNETRKINLHVAYEARNSKRRSGIRQGTGTCNRLGTARDGQKLAKVQELLLCERTSMIRIIQEIATCMRQGTARDSQVMVKER
jgi:hypothetical protein